MKEADLCYQCKERKRSEDLIAFCSQVCHEQWAKENPKDNRPNGRRRMSGDELREACLRLGREAGLKRKSNLVIQRSGVSLNH